MEPFAFGGVRFQHIEKGSPTIFLEYPPPLTFFSGLSLFVLEFDQLILCLQYFFCLMIASLVGPWLLSFGPGGLVGVAHLRGLGQRFLQEGHVLGCGFFLNFSLEFLPYPTSHPLLTGPGKSLSRFHRVGFFDNLPAPVVSVWSVGPTTAP